MIIIAIEKLKIACIIGCLAQERILPGNLIIDIKLSCHLPPSDDIHQTINYVTVAEAIEKIAIHGQFHLLETLAVTIVNYFFNEFVTVQKVWIKIAKPSAIMNAESCFVEYVQECN